eukprot:78739-Chlamydomonas_euryale.AAC.3
MARGGGRVTFVEKAEASWIAARLRVWGCRRDTRLRICGVGCCQVHAGCSNVYVGQGGQMRGGSWTPYHAAQTVWPGSPYPAPMPRFPGGQLAPCSCSCRTERPGTSVLVCVCGPGRPRHACWRAFGCMASTDGACAASDFSVTCYVVNVERFAVRSPLGATVSAAHGAQACPR